MAQIHFSPTYDYKVIPVLGKFVISYRKKGNHKWDAYSSDYTDISAAIAGIKRNIDNDIQQEEAKKICQEHEGIDF